MDQKLILISGSPYVGKTTICEKLYQKLDNSAYLDGDWVCHFNPFSIKDPRVREVEITNASFVISTYLKMKFKYVFFSSVILTDKNIREKIITKIDAKNFKTIGFTLMCSEETLSKRHKKRGGKNEVSYHWLRLETYPGDIVIDTDNKKVRQIVDEIKNTIYEI